MNTPDFTNQLNREYEARMDQAERIDTYRRWWADHQVERLANGEPGVNEDVFDLGAYPEDVTLLKTLAQVAHEGSTLDVFDLLEKWTEQLRARALAIAEHRNLMP